MEVENIPLANWRNSPEYKHMVEEFQSLCSNIRRKGFTKFVNTLIEQTDFFDAPASAKFYGNDYGGLLRHSIDVAKGILKFGDVFEPTSALIIGLFHDVCKTNLYVSNVLKDGKISDKVPFKIDDKLPIGHGSKSIFLLQKYGLEMSTQELVCIRWHMLAFDKAYWTEQSYIEKVAPEVKLVHACDLIASYLD